MKEEIKKIVDELEKVKKLGADCEKIYQDLKRLIEWEPKEMHEYSSELGCQIIDMNVRNKRIALAKYEMGYKDGAWGIAYSNRKETWRSYNGGGYVGCIDNPELTFETKEQAEHIIKMIGLN